MVPCKLLTPSAKGAQDGGENPAFSELFCNQSNASLHALPGGRFPWNLNTKGESVWYEFLQNKIAKFSMRIIYPQDTIFGFCRHTSGARTPALAFRSRANLSIASYSRRAKVFPQPWIFPYDLPFSRHRRANSPHNSRDFVKFRYILAAATASVVRHSLHSWQPIADLLYRPCSATRV